MADTRRGFLKTLGKLGAALGITTAAACSAHHHGHHGGHHPPKAKPRTAPKAKIELKPRSQGASKMVEGQIKFAGNVTTTNRPKGAFEFGFTGFKTDPMAADKIKQLNDDANLLYNSILDNKSRAINPQMIVPPHVYEYITKRHLMDEMDPYNWGAVFDVKWVDWHSTDARFATKRAYWEARVNRPYRGIFKESVYRQAVELPMQYLAMRVDDVNPVQEHAKRNAYEDLVSALRTAIQVVIDTDKRMNPGASAPKRTLSGHVDMQSITK